MFPCGIESAVRRRWRKDRLLLGDNTGDGVVQAAADYLPRCWEFGFELKPSYIHIRLCIIYYMHTNLM